MTTTIRRHGNILVIDLVGELISGNGSGVLREHVRQLMGDGCDKIIINLRGMTRIDRVGVDELQGCRTEAAARGMDLQIANLDAPHQRRTELERWLDGEAQPDGCDDEIEVH
ncbi:MAG: STAS domain-containing protein [Acidobacteriota bacterium]